MSSSRAQRSPPHLLTVGDFDPQGDKAIEYDFIGRVIAGRYTVLKHIGGGGMADVYQATDEQLGIQVAIKLLKPRMASDELRARMVQEAQAAAQIRHSNVVRVFGTGALDSTAFIVMELLDGPNLEQYLHEYRGGRMPVREAIELLLPAIEALHEIHAQGYIHRDIKTGNILVTREPGLQGRRPRRRRGRSHEVSAPRGEGGVRQLRELQGVAERRAAQPREGLPPHPWAAFRAPGWRTRRRRLGRPDQEWPARRHFRDGERGVSTWRPRLDWHRRQRRPPRPSRQLQGLDDTGSR